MSGEPPGGDRQGLDWWTATALEAVFRARAPGVDTSTPLVGRLARGVGRALDFDEADLRLLEIAARVRDIGMVGLPDAVLLNTRVLTPEDWELVSRHPVLGAQLLAGLAPVAAAAPLVRSHHERWDGEGYPDRLQGDAIPVPSRIIALCDAFVAISIDRPYRRGLGAHAALEHVQRERDTQFDPRITDTFASLLEGIADGPPDIDRPPPVRRRVSTNGITGVRQHSGSAGDLPAALAEFTVVPAFALARDRLLEALTSDGGNPGLVTAAIESDTGLTVAVLRAAQPSDSRRRISNVPNALTMLSSEQIRAAVDELPTVTFPWRRTPLEMVLHRSRIHAQAVVRAVERIGFEVSFNDRDDLRTAALLHDVGRLVLSRVSSEPPDTNQARAATPEERVHDERRRLGFDHASLGGLMIAGWGLPHGLVRAVRDHHTATAGDTLATFVRLGDMLVHHALGDAVDRRRLLRAAGACELTASTLRDVMFDLPHTGGSQWRRSERSPLTTRETDVLQQLAAGKVYNNIASELGLSASTIRTHLQKIYVKIGVQDRAQAVLHATERGWL